MSNSSRPPALLNVFGPVQFRHMIAGMSGGIVSTLILHPLDLLKIRFAVNDGAAGKPHYTSLGQAVSSIVRSEGVRGLYRGVASNTLTAGSAWGSYFLFYQTIKSHLQGGQAHVQLAPSEHLVAASEAGLLTLVLTNPITVVKTRLCLQLQLKQPIDNSKHYSGMADAFQKIVKHEGIGGLYKGFVPGLCGVIHGAIQFMAYEDLKNRYNVYRGKPIDTPLSPSTYLMFAALSKLFAAVTTYPYQVIRARLQDTDCKYSGSWDCVKKTVRHEGVSGLYKGLTPYMVHVMPNICLVFLIYEYMVNR
eukprot:GFUD01023188.1.p1 GENE.GFUD01023188.1~~GFUD01023188.1.p1  ORF type:complete len:305 (+),score=50.45 GFUD01023188.1:198-1112(+)